MKPKYYAQGTMNTKDGQLLGTVRYNPAQRKWQSNIDGELSGEFKTKEEAIDDLKRAGVKNIKINKDYVMEGKIKPTNRQIMIVEDFVKKTAKSMMKEASDGNALIANTLKLIADQVGLNLQADDYFTGIKVHKGQKYFNVELNQRTSESAEFDKLQKFANKSKLIKVEPNGVNRVSIFLTDKLMSYINK